MYENKQKRPKFHFFFDKNRNKNDSPLGFVLLFTASFRLESFGRCIFFLTRQHSYFGVMHCENSEFQITFFGNESCYRTGNLYKDLFFVYLLF